MTAPPLTVQLVLGSFLLRMGQQFEPILVGNTEIGMDEVGLTEVR